MKLRDVVDLEAQLAFDEGRADDELRARDREIYLALSPPPSEREALLSCWLEALRSRPPGLRYGERVESAQRLLRYLLVAIGVSSGWGTAEVLLHFEQGAAPINVGHYLLVLVFGQLALLALLGLGFVLRRWLSDLPVLGDVTRLLRQLSVRLARFTAERPELRAELEAHQATQRRVRARLGLYAELERYLLLGQSQLFGVAFNVGALVSCVRLVLLTDLAFGWSTSVAALGAEQVERVCAVLSAPFAWLLPDAVPTRSLIEHTQYFRLEGRFAGAAVESRGDPALAGEWWRFLVACTVTYGLLPRVLTFTLTKVGLLRAQRRVPLDTPAVQRLVARMTTPALSTRARELPAQGAEPARRVAPLPAQGDAPAVLILFRDIPAPGALIAGALAQRLGVRVGAVHHAGGADARADAALLSALREHAGPACVVVEAFEAPDKGLRSLLAAAREALGPRRALWLALIGEARADGWAAPTHEDVRLFRDRLTLLQDPYLSVEALPAFSAGTEVHA